MPRPSLPPRLYLVKSKDRPSAWAVRHGEVFIRTGFAEADVDKAATFLNRYIEGASFDIPRERYIPPMAAPCDRPTLIYFASCDLPDFPIKIGSASNLERRVRQIQGSMPFKVIVLTTMPGTVNEERHLHMQFRALRIRGEWFKREKAILDYIARSVEVNHHSEHMRRRATTLIGEFCRNATRSLEVYRP